MKAWSLHAYIECKFIFSSDEIKFKFFFKLKKYINIKYIFLKIENKNVHS
jgi:hypothetical protein